MTTYVNVYEAGRSYGGPEEGGWWFDTGHCIATYLLVVTPIYEDEDNDESDDREWAERLAAEGLRDRLMLRYPRTNKRSSVLGGEDWNVWIESRPGRDYPTERPHYE